MLLEYFLLTTTLYLLTGNSYEDKDPHKKNFDFKKLELSVVLHKIDEPIKKRHRIKFLQGKFNTVVYAL